jgi:hypothetical protein
MLSIMTLNTMFIFNLTLTQLKVLCIGFTSKLSLKTYQLEPKLKSISGTCKELKVYMNRGCYQGSGMVIKTKLRTKRKVGMLIQMLLKILSFSNQIRMIIMMQIVFEEIECFTQCHLFTKSKMKTIVYILHTTNLIHIHKI